MCKSIVSTVVFSSFVLCLPIGACCLERSLSGFVMAYASFRAYDSLKCVFLARVCVH